MNPDEQSGPPPKPEAPLQGVGSGGAKPDGATGGASANRGGAQGFWSRAADEAATQTANAVRWGIPALGRFGSAFADWLVVVSWGKFFLLSLLLLIFAAVMFSLSMFSGSPEVIHVTHGTVDVKVHVIPIKTGSLLLQSAVPTESAPRPTKKSTSKGRHSVVIAPDSGDGAALHIQGDGDNTPDVRIDRNGVRISADEDGDKALVIIDHNGVRIERGAAADAAGKGDAKASAGAGGAQPSGTVVGPAQLPAEIREFGPAVRVTPESLEDAGKVESAVEAARGEVEDILQDQVDEQMRGIESVERVERENWLEALAFLVIIGLIILKIVLGSKVRAESRARQASATAAQEGLKRQLAEAQIKMMQAQVEPHFLFNTLASVDYLIETDPSRASRMQKNLIQYLRAALPQMREGSSTLGREVQQCRSYLEILKMRMDERLQFSINVPQGLLSASFPPMMLLTLVENAIKHGLEPKPEGGTLSVGAGVGDGMLRVSVADSGLGFGAGQNAGTGVGLANVRERLRALFGPSAGLVIDGNAQGGTIATINVPYRIESAGADPATGMAAAAAV
jgi:hypothetical protein